MRVPNWQKHSKKLPKVKKRPQKLRQAKKRTKLFIKSLYSQSNV